MNAGECAQVGAAGECARIQGDQFALFLQKSEFGVAVEQVERCVSCQGLIDYIFIFFFFQGTS